MLDLPSAVETVRQVREYIDVIEVGTLLCLSEGMKAIRDLSSNYNNKTIVGDVRIVRAGGKIAEMVFDAGAHWVTVVSEAPIETIEAAVRVSQRYNGQVQIELGNDWDPEMARKWRDLGIEQLIYHSTAEVEEVGGSVWTGQALNQIQEMAKMGFKVSVTGGIKPEVIPVFAGIPVFAFIAGRAIWKTGFPDQAAFDFQNAIAKNFHGLN